jgi:hypothetical protein
MAKRRITAEKKIYDEIMSGSGNMETNHPSFEFVWGNTDFRQFADKLSVIIFASMRQVCLCESSF